MSTNNYTECKYLLCVARVENNEQLVYDYNFFEKLSDMEEWAKKCISYGCTIEFAGEIKVVKDYTLQIIKG